MGPSAAKTKIGLGIHETALARRSPERTAIVFLSATTIILLLVTVVCVVRVTISGDGLNYVSGTWAGLALDAAHGLLYRPMIGPLGYGGTRYMPIGFLVHAAFIKLFGDPIAAGHLSMFLAATLLLAGIYRLVKLLTGYRQAALLAAALVLTSTAIQIELVSVRGDVLASALDIWGLFFCARAMTDLAKQRDSLAASAFFALAFLTKFTMLFGVAAGIASFGFNSRKRDAGVLAATWIAFIAIGLTLIYLISDGRFLEVFRHSATGGATWKSLLLGPTMWFRVADADDPWTLAILALCASALLAFVRNRWREVVPLFLIVTTAGTVLMFGSPGVWANHLTDMSLAAVAFLAVEARRNRRYRTLMTSSFAMITLFATAHIFFRVHSGGDYFSPTRPAPESLKDDWSKAARLIGGQGPLLSENPWLPILSGETPYALDSFSFRLAATHQPELAADLSSKLDSHFFKGVALVHDPANTGGRDFMDQWDFGPGIADHLMKSYRAAYVCRYFVLYLPRGNSGPGRTTDPGNGP